MKLTRRRFVVGAASLLAVPAFSQSSARTAFVSPNGGGDGSSASSPAQLSQISSLIKQVGAGGVIIVLASGEYRVSEPITISAGGTAAAPVTITGGKANGSASLARIRGTRRPWSEARSISGAVNAKEFGGNTLFALANGASHLRIANLHIIDTGRILDMGGLRASGITVDNVRFTNIRDGIYTNEGSRVSNVHLRKFSGRGYSKKAVRFHGRCSNWLLEACELDSGWQYGDSFAVGIEASDQANGLRIVGGFTSNALDRRSGEDAYWNGDGVASERGNYNISIENHKSTGNSDGGYDLKSESTQLVNCVSEGNKRNYRIWGGTRGTPTTLLGCASLSPRDRGGTGGDHHIWLRGTTSGSSRAASVLCQQCVLSGAPESDVAIFADGGNVAVHLVDTKLSLPRSTELFVSSQETSRIVVGSASDSGVRSILTGTEIVAVAGAAANVTLEADDVATWSLLESNGDVAVSLAGDRLTLLGTTAGATGSFLVQARDSRGEAMQQRFSVAMTENPVGPGAVLSLAFLAGAASTPVIDQTGLNAVQVVGTPAIEQDGFPFSGQNKYLEVPPSDNFRFSGPFTIKASFSIDPVTSQSGHAIVSVWKTSSNQRSFALGVDGNSRLLFQWSNDGRSRDGNTIFGPALAANRRYEVEIRRGQSGVVELHLDGVLVAESTSPVGPLYAARAPLRVSGRADGGGSTSGILYGLTVVNTATPN